LHRAEPLTEHDPRSDRRDHRANRASAEKPT